MSRTGKPRETKGGLVVARGWEEEWRGTANGPVVSFGDDGNVLKSYGDDGCTTL